MTGGKCGENLIWSLSGGTLIISGKCKMENYDCGIRSRKAPAPWFDLNGAIKKIIVNDGVTTIGNSAFYNCTKLTDVKFPNSLTKIGDGAFYDCWNLTGVDIPYGVETIGNSAFGACFGLSYLTISESVVDIGAWAFNACEGLRIATIPASVIKIGKSVFAACVSLKKIYYPAGRGFEKFLGTGYGAQLIPYNTAPPSAKVKSPTLKPALPAQLMLKFIPYVKSIFASPVAKSKTQLIAEKLRWKVEGKTLTVGGVREIKNYSYDKIPWIDSLNTIQKIIIEEGVEKISANAFIDCRRLELLTIPASLKTIGDLAFTACYCGNIFENGGRNVFWCLEDGVLILKKNPAANSNSDFSTGFVSWLAVEKNIVSFKLEPGIVPKEKFFEWLAKCGNVIQISFA